MRKALKRLLGIMHGFSYIAPAIAFLLWAGLRDASANVHRRVSTSSGVESIVQDSGKTIETQLAFDKDAPVGISNISEENVIEEYPEQVKPNPLPEKIAYMEIVGRYGKELTEMIVRHEGLRTRAYTDTEGYRTIGIGFNLDRDGARKEVEAQGIDYDAIFSGRKEITKEQAFYFFRRDIDTAEEDARRYIGESFDRLPKEARGILIDMAFMGYGKLKGFTGLREALIKGDYDSAADEMDNSKWRRQTKTRGAELVDAMRKLAK